MAYVQSRIVVRIFKEFAEGKIPAHDRRDPQQGKTAVPLGQKLGRLDVRGNRHRGTGISAHVSSTLSSQPKLMEWVWDCRFADPLSKRMVGSCQRHPLIRTERSLRSSCPLPNPMNDEGGTSQFYKAREHEDYHDHETLPDAVRACLSQDKP
jgi:hypothetical protein